MEKDESGIPAKQEDDQDDRSEEGDEDNEDPEEADIRDMKHKLENLSMPLFYKLDVFLKNPLVLYSCVV